MKIAVYSGSFNPLHIGHLAILEYLVQKTDFDKVYLIVSPVNPFKEGVKQTSAEERLRLAQEAISRHTTEITRERHSKHVLCAQPDGTTSDVATVTVEVKDIELTMPAPHYTIKTLDALKASEPDNDFTLVIGGDNLSAFTRWRDYERILKDYGLAVYPRDGYSIDKAIDELNAAIPDMTREDIVSRIKLIHSPLVNISSTTIREGLAAGRDMSDWMM